MTCVDLLRKLGVFVVEPFPGCVESFVLYMLTTSHACMLLHTVEQHRKSFGGAMVRIRTHLGKHFGKSFTRAVSARGVLPGHSSKYVSGARHFQGCRQRT